MPRLAVLLLSMLVFAAACAPATSKDPRAGAATSGSRAGPGSVPSGLRIGFEKFELDNGLDVILHVDRSDPVVAIDLAIHAGSGREVEGRTGFAHLFEHLLFLDSENLGYGGLDELNVRVGGTGSNGFTGNDETHYFQVVPADALEKVIWAEAEKLGWFINTVTQDVIDNEKQVVKNEKRQGIDNLPYGHEYAVVSKAMYPAGHPYSWTIIGSLADVDAATRQDARDFYRRWYVPNNATLTISGDIDVAEATAWVTKYFGEIPRGADIEPVVPRPAVLEKTISLYHEDNFATVPRLTMTWPTVERFHPDSHALAVLATHLTNGKRAPLNRVMVEEDRVTTDVSMSNESLEIAGMAALTISGNPGQDLDDLLASLDRGFARFERDGISPEDLDRIKAGREVDFYRDVQSNIDKAISLGTYNMFTNDPGYVREDLGAMLAVSPDDVMRVYDAYIRDKPCVVTSFVPKGHRDLALEGAERAAVTEEEIIQGAEKEIEFDPTRREFEPTPSAIDRSTEPPFGKPIELARPDVWRSTMGRGIELFGIENTETPIVHFSLSIDAGRDRGDPAKPAVPALTADMLMKGTVNRTAAELEDAFDALGASVVVRTSATRTVIDGKLLARTLDETAALIEEMLLEPRWDEDEFELLKRIQLVELTAGEADPERIVDRESAKLLYPDDDHMFHYPAYGTPAKLEAVALADLKRFYANTYRPENAQLRVAGAASERDVREAFAGLADRWEGPRLEAVSLPQPRPATRSRIYFYDVPGAKQSSLWVGGPSLTALDPDYPLVGAINDRLGGSYTSRLNTELRINRGYTYGAGSSFSGEKDRGVFVAGTDVRSNVTRESLALIRDIIAGFGSSFTQEDLVAMKESLKRREALATETLDAKLAMLGEIADFGYPDDYRSRNAALLDALTLDDLRKLVAKYLETGSMYWLVVGDARTQAGRLGDLDFGEPVMLAPADRQENN